MARVMARTRLDAALVERGHFPTRARAQAAVLAGRVRVDGRAAEKPGTAVVPDSAIDVEAAQEYVSRGGRKLANALDALALDVSGALVLDLGASTGGFTDCLLQRGAARSIALDVGYGQLDWRLRNDERVTVLERTNAREITSDSLPFVPNLVTCDLAFISVATVWPAIAPCIDTAYRALILVKPQFEVGRGGVGKGGVVRDRAARIDAVRRVAHAVGQTGGRAAGVVESGLPGPAGNHEIFLYAVGPDLPDPGIDLDAAIDAAVPNDGERP